MRCRMAFQTSAQIDWFSTTVNKLEEAKKGLVQKRNNNWQDLKSQKYVKSDTVQKQVICILHPPTPPHPSSKVWRYKVLNTVPAVCLISKCILGNKS